MFASLDHISLDVLRTFSISQESLCKHITGKLVQFNRLEIVKSEEMAISVTYAKHSFPALQGARLGNIFPTD